MCTVIRLIFSSSSFHGFKMLSRCARRRSRQRVIRWFIIAVILSITLLLIRANPKRTALVTGNISSARLFCVVLSTHSTHERFVYMSNITWLKRCDSTAIVRYKRSENRDDGKFILIQLCDIDMVVDINIPQSKYYVNLWTRILGAIRQMIGVFDSIYENDLLVIVPAPTFIFREKLSPLLHSFNPNVHSPMFVIYEQQDANAYIANGNALNLLKHSDLIDSCLQKSYPSARENYLWKCVHDSLNNEGTYKPCENKECFVRYQRDQLTLAHIKNGFCLEKDLSICRTIALLHPVNANDLLNLEFFTYRLKPNS